jgi:aspartate 1-decarboxylase
MKREILGGKIHSVRITQSNLAYEGSCAIDVDLLEGAGILPFERIHIYNINTGHRLDTYAIEAKRGSGTIGLNGAAARLGQVGDKVIIVSFVQLDEDEIPKYRSKVVLVDEHNHVKKIVRHKVGSKA